MTKIAQVFVHPGFESGAKNAAYHTDKPIMELWERVRMAKWFAAVLAGGPHEGLNKPSWMRNGREIPAAALYKKYNIWHYQCGPTYDDPIRADHQDTGSLLGHNEFGRKSPEVYHYAKQGDVIIVLGYSRLHKPFPDPESRSNPVRNRGLNLAAAIPKR